VKAWSTPPRRRERRRTGLGAKRATSGSAWAATSANRDDVRLLMASCCNPRGCDRFFTARFDRWVARRYRRRGLDKAARRMVGFLQRAGTEGATVHEVGGGVGEILIELLKRGAERSVNLELSPAYEPEAERLLAEAGLEVARSGGCTTSPSIPTPSSRPMLSCSVGWSAAIPTSSGCSGRPLHALAPCSTSATRDATRFVHRGPERRLSSSAKGVPNVRASAIRDARCCGRARARRLDSHSGLGAQRGPRKDMGNGGKLVCLAVVSGALLGLPSARCGAGWAAAGFRV
jgi:hypothetical protein